MHLAQLNIGRLRATPGAPEVAEFMASLDRINGMGKRMPGFVWMMEGSGEPGTGNTENNIGDDPRFVANLTVWEDVASLRRFAFGTIHRQFYERRAEWFNALSERHFVMWSVPVGHRPPLTEGLERLERLKSDGAGNEAFDWAWWEAQQGAEGPDLARCAG